VNADDRAAVARLATAAAAALHVPPPALEPIPPHDPERPDLMARWNTRYDTHRREYAQMEHDQMIRVRTVLAMLAGETRIDADAILFAVGQLDDVAAIPLPYQAACPDCWGEGAEAQAACGTCGGTGARPILPPPTSV
jgi:hypothetical protein